MSAEASIGPTQCIRSLFSEYERVNNPIVSEYISSIPESLSDAVKRIQEELTVTNAENVLSSRRKLESILLPFIVKRVLTFPALTKVE